MTDLVLQLLLVVLLLLTVTWCVLVHFRLRRFRLERGELQELIDALGLAAGRAELAIAGLREAGHLVENELTRQNRQAVVHIEALKRLASKGRAAVPSAQPAEPAQPAKAMPAGLKAELLEALAALR